MLSRTLQLPVFGTRKPLLKSHSNADGFDPAFAHILVAAALARDSVINDPGGTAPPRS